MDKPNLPENAPIKASQKIRVSLFKIQKTRQHGLNA
jgi:hypothetical protein